MFRLVEEWKVICVVERKRGVGVCFSFTSLWGNQLDSCRDSVEKDRGIGKREMSEALGETIPEKTGKDWKGL